MLNESYFKVIYNDLSDGGIRSSGGASLNRPTFLNIFEGKTILVIKKPKRCLKYCLGFIFYECITVSVLVAFVRYQTALKSLK